MGRGFVNRRLPGTRMDPLSWVCRAKLAARGIATSLRLSISCAGRRLRVRRRGVLRSGSGRRVSLPVAT